MKVCFLCRGFASNGGIGRVISVLSDKLADDTDVFLLSFFNEKASSYYAVNPKCKQATLYPAPISMTKAILIKNAVKKLSDYIKENKIDIVIACGALFYPMAVMAAHKTQIKSICWEHTNPNNKSDYNFQDIARRFGAKRSDANVVLTKSALQVYQTRFPKANNYQIYNPIDPDLLKHEYDYDIASKRIVSVGRLRPQKNFSRLLDIASSVMKDYPEWEWDIFGEGPLREELETKRDALGLERQVHFCGQVSDLYERYHNYSFMVMTSDYEGFPMTLLEGAANKLPLVAFDVPTGPSEIIENGKNGFLCENGDIDGISDKISILINDNNTRKKMAFYSKETANRFQISAIEKAWHSLLKELIR